MKHFPFLFVKTIRKDVSMKLLIQAFVAAVVIHLIYFLMVGLVGLIKTLTYHPNLTINQNSVLLQKSISFGKIEVSTIYPYSFIFAIVVFYILLRFMNGVKKTA